MKFLIVVLMLTLLAGCGGRPAPAAPRPDTTAACCPPESATPCCGSSAPGAVCAAPPPDSTGPAAVPKKPVSAGPVTAALPRLWEFGRGTCVPCKTMKGILDPMMTEFAGKVEVRIISIDDEPALTKQYRIMTIPTQVFIDSTGNEVFRHVGVFPRDSIVAKFKEFGWE